MANTLAAREMSRRRWVEFICLLGMLSATVALSIDGMLPAMDVMANELTPSQPNAMGLVVALFILGLGVGTFFVGPLSDFYGRKPVLLGGLILFIGASIWCSASDNIEQLLIGRVLQGLGAAAPRVCAISVTRDCFSGRQMARVTSFVMVVFNLVPAIAPSIGALVLHFHGWRAIFWGFALFGSVTALWLAARLPETRAIEAQKPLNWHTLASSTREVLSHRTTRNSLAVQMLCYGALFAMLSVIQQTFQQVFDRGEVFHLWFGFIALVAGAASFTNASLVIRMGMRPIVRAVLWLVVGMSSLMLLVVFCGAPQSVIFALFICYQVSIFLMAAMCIGNLTSLALEPVGHIAGLAASINTATATIGAVGIAVIVAFSFNGTLYPMTISILVCALLGVWLMAKIRRPTDDVDHPA